MTLRRSSSDVVQELTTRLSQIFGDASAIQEALALLQDASMDLAARQRALGSLVGLKAEETREVLPGLLDQKDMRIDAIRAFGSLEDERAPKWILERYPAMEFQEKRAAVETLSSRKNYANALLDALKGGVVPKGDIPVYIARSLSQILGRQFTSVFGDIQELSQDKAAQIEKYRSLLMSDRMDRADVHQGRLLFQSVCASCHQLYGEGGEIGPDLTGSNRADIDYILLNMIDPSADVPDAYKAVTVTTRDGQVMVGTIAAEDDQRMVIKSVGQSHTVLKRDIRQRSRSELSMMPEGLLQALSNSQVLDLVKYLQTREQVELP